jgi:thiol:disulfide interchange protein
MKKKSLITICTTVAVIAASLTVAAAKEFPKDSPEFEADYATALKKAKETSKPLIVIFSAVWCPPCQTNKNDVYPSATVKPFHDKFVWAYLDTDDAKNHPAAKKFSVSGIPHIEFLNSNGKSIGQVVGGTTPDTFAKSLKSALQKSK